MHVDVPALSLIISALTMVVVALGGLAALRQLRYLRHGNELATLTGLGEDWDSDTMRASRAFVQEQLAGALQEPEFLAELNRRPMGPRAQNVARVGNFFDQLGVYVFTGALTERMVIFIWGDAVERHWHLMRDAIAINRQTHGDILEFFEDLALRVPAWRDPEGRGWRGKLRRDPKIASISALKARAAVDEGVLETSP